MFIANLSRMAAVAAGCLVLMSARPTAQAITGVLVTGSIDELTVTNPNDVYSGGRMVVNGQVIIIPRNLIITLPANWLTLQEMFDQAPPAAKAVGKSGLAKLDGLGTHGFATVLGNRTRFGNVIAGEVTIEKGIEVANGTVTYIDYTQGYLRIDGIVGDDTTGLMIRPNDPTGRHTIQSGKGCAGGPNCSPDVRYTNDPDNYTIAFVTGYPAGIPSTVPLGQRPGFQAGDPAAAASDASGVGDPFCPATNRGINPVLDSTRFAPIQIGDSITAEGNFETIAGEYFLSCHTMQVKVGLLTQNSPTQPDYMIFDEVEWDAAAFQNLRSRMLIIGFTTLNDSPVDVFKLAVNPQTNENVEIPIASTIGNPDAINQGIVAGTGGIFKFLYDVDFDPTNAPQPERSPCAVLANAGFPPCPGVNPLLEDFNVLSPITREVQGRSRHVLNPGVITRDINGREATNGQYLTPIGVGFPEFGEINLNALQTPVSFDGIPWLMDRRLGPHGCDGACPNTRQPLDPFPVSDIDPGFLAPGGRQRMLSFFPFGPNNVLPWPPIAPAALPIGVTPKPIGGGLPVIPVANFNAANTSGQVPLTVAFTDTSTGTVGARLWSFGDGTFSTEQNPVHTFTGAGNFSVSLTALGAAGTHTATRANLIQATLPGPNPPVANFTASPTAGSPGLVVNFTNTTVGEATQWSWSFGDGSSSNLQNPSHTYVSAGLFTVSLTATGPGGSNTAIKTAFVNVTVPGGLVVDFIANNATTGNAPLRVQFIAQNIVGRATSGVFNFGDGQTGNVSSNNARIAHTYQAPGVYTVTLTATDGTNTVVVQKVGFVTVN